MNKDTDNKSFEYKRIKKHRNELGLTQEDLAQWMGLKRLTISRYEKGDNIPPESLIKLKQFMDITSKDDMFTTFFDDYGMECERLSAGKFKLNIPYVPASLYGDFLETDDPEKAKLSLIFDNINSGFYVAFEVRGEAMNNNSRYSLSAGDIAVAKEIKIEDLTEDINPTEFWVIILENDILIRRIERYSRKENKVEFKALNPSLEYADFSLNIPDIKRLFQVTQKIMNF